MANAKRKKRQNKSQYFDYTLLTVVFFLLCIGLVMLYSVSSYDAKLTFDDSMFYLKNQFKNTLFGIVLLLIVMNLDYHRFEKWYLIAYIVSAVLIVLVLTPLGYEANGARRWLNLGVSLQPAEVAKVGLIIYCASRVCRMGTRRLSELKGAIRLFFPCAVVAGMVFIITDNMSSAIIILGICGVMVYMSTPDYKPYVLIILIGAFFVSMVILFVSKDWIPEFLKSSSGMFRIERIKAWLHPESYANDKAFQTIQALYAIGSGGLFGKGLGESLQKQFVPEAQNDMIFAIICEELGLFGAILIMGLFILLLWRIMDIIYNARDLFGMMLASGVFAHISIQVVLNLAVVTNLIPNTGISLPFISYGGSSVVFLLIEIGIVLSVGRQAIFEEQQ